MDFLTKSIYIAKSGGDSTDSKLAGAVLTRFDPNDILSRATQRYVSYEELRQGANVKPQGFKLDDNGILLSDTNSRVELLDTLADYVGGVFDGLNKNHQRGLIDLILRGVKYGCTAFVNYGQWSEDITTDPILVPLSSFRVSNSSFNVYASYRRPDSESWKTFSLMDIAEDKPYCWYIVIPNSARENFEDFKSYLTEVKPHSSSNSVFLVDIPLRPSESYPGEAFLNYLAYNVAYCEMGQKIMKEFMQETQYVSDTPEDRVYQKRKTPKYNLSIQSSCRKPCVSAIIACDGDTDRLSSLIRADEEAYITLRWMQRIFSEAEKIQGENFDEKLATACVALGYECRTQGLHFGLELLAQRYFLFTAGSFELNLSTPLRGGGVNGQSITRITR